MEWLVGVSVVVLLISSVPVSAALFISAAIALFFFTGTSLDVLALTSFSKIRSSSLLAVLFFILAGGMMTKGSIAKKIIDFASQLVGFIPGGMAIAGVMACGIFAAISGSSPATVVAIGSIMIPVLSEQEYDAKFSTGLLASSGSMGILIPPSIPMIIYALIVGVSVAELFLAGILPGILMIAAFSIYANRYARRTKTVQRLPFKPKLLLLALKDGFWALGMPVLILGGIYSGVFTPTEAAAVAVVYTIFVELVIYRSMNLKEFLETVLDSSVMTSTLVIIFVGASALGEYLTIEQIPNAIAEYIVAGIESPLLFLLAVNVLLLFIGTFMDILSAMLILMPIFAQILLKYEISPIHFAIIFIFNMEIGYLTPPFGVNLFVASTITKQPFGTVVKACFPTVLIMLCLLMLFTFFPQISLFLPNLIMR
jgi:C4-dicarboxylate transporter, DctM subunit